MMRGWRELDPLLIHGIIIRLAHGAALRPRVAGVALTGSQPD